jgi:hypothetical protein
MTVLNITLPKIGKLLFGNWQLLCFFSELFHQHKQMFTVIASLTIDKSTCLHLFYEAVTVKSWLYPQSNWENPKNPKFRSKSMTFL